MTSPPSFTLVDVGARGGIDRRWRRFADVLRVVAIDADKNAAPADTRGVRRYDYVCAAVGAAPSSVPLYLTREPACSSTFRPNRALLDQFPEPSRFDVTDVATVDVRSLDQIARDHDLRGIDFLKVDTQGSELAILSGAGESLGAAVGIEVEVEFLPLYEGQPLFGTVDGFLRAHGFELFDLNRVYWRRSARVATGRGQLVFADALYFRSFDSLATRAAGPGLALAKAVLAAVAYGYLDYAAALLAKGREHRVLGGPDGDLAAAWLQRGVRHTAPLSWLARIKGAGRVSRALARAAESLRPDEWAYVDGRLGNSGK